MWYHPTNRCGVPDEIKAKLQKREIVSKMMDGDVMALKWMDQSKAAEGRDSVKNDQ